MLFKKLVELCKKRITVELWRDGDITWLSNGEVYAKLNEDTSFEFSDIICIMELSDEKAECITTSKAEFLTDERHIFNPRQAEEIKPVRYSINCDGFPLQPFVTTKGVLFVPLKHMAIFRDVGCKSYYLSEFRGGYIVLVAVDNMTIGMIRPHKVNLEAMKDFASGFNAQVLKAHENEFCGGDYQYSLV